MRKITLVVSVLMLLVAVGCEEKEIATSSAPPEPVVAEAPVPAEPVAAESVEVTEPTPAAPAEQEAVMAYVNGKPLYMAPLIEMLVSAQGINTAQLLITAELIDQAAAAKGITVSDEEIKAEHDKTLENIPVFAREKDLAKREDMLNRMLPQRGMSRAQWDTRMSRNVMLSKLVLPEIKVTDEEVANLYEEKYGRKNIAKHIQSKSVTDAQMAIDRVKNGEAFDVVVRAVPKITGVNQGGVLPAVGSQSSNFPPPLKDAILGLKRVGDMSDAVMFNNRYFVFYLDSIVEAQDVKLEDVKEELSTEIIDGMMNGERQKKLGEMMKEAKIEYVNPILKKKQEEKEKALAEREKAMAEQAERRAKMAAEQEKQRAKMEAEQKERGGTLEIDQAAAKEYADKEIAKIEAAAKAAKEAAGQADNTEAPKPTGDSK